MSLPKLDTENSNRAVSSNEMGTVVKGLPTGKSPGGPEGVSVGYHQICQEGLVGILLGPVHELEKEGHA